MKNNEKLPLNLLTIPHDNSSQQRYDDSPLKNIEYFDSHTNVHSGYMLCNLLYWWQVRSAYEKYMCDGKDEKLGEHRDVSF